MSSNYDVLPHPDRWGNFYLCDTKTAPAIFVINNETHPDRGRWMACPADEDVPFEGGRIRAFGSPEQALAWLRARARKGARC